jgi:hypothetical protein
VSGGIATSASTDPATPLHATDAQAPADRRHAPSPPASEKPTQGASRAAEGHTSRGASLSPPSRMSKMPAKTASAPKAAISMRAALSDPVLLGGVLAGDSWRAWRVLLIAPSSKP